MKSYDGDAVDSYMRATLDQDLERFEVDNALTLLTTLTSIAEKDFPHERTFVKTVKTRTYRTEEDKLQGISIYHVKDDGEIRSLNLAREDLSTLQSAMDALFVVLKQAYTLDQP